MLLEHVRRRYKVFHTGNGCTAYPSLKVFEEMNNRNFKFITLENRIRQRWLSLLANI